MISFRGKVVTWGTRRLWQKYEEYIINYKIEILICFMYVNNFSSFPQVASCYECLPRSVAETFIRCCYMCGLQRPQQNQAPLKLIISSGFMTRRQVSVRNEIQWFHCCVHSFSLPAG